MTRLFGFLAYKLFKFLGPAAFFALSHYSNSFTWMSTYFFGASLLTFIYGFGAVLLSLYRQSCWLEEEVFLFF
jgi:hypothetical protein